MVLKRMSHYGYTFTIEVLFKYDGVNTLMGNDYPISQWPLAMDPYDPLRPFPDYILLLCHCLPSNVFIDQNNHQHCFIKLHQFL